jgi:hypothetical protein
LINYQVEQRQPNKLTNPSINRKSHVQVAQAKSTRRTLQPEKDNNRTTYKQFPQCGQ